VNQQDPTPEGLAAIVAAVEALWPQPVAVAVEVGERSEPWRFSGRWWVRPIPHRRERPWIG